MPQERGLMRVGRLEGIRPRGASLDKIDRLNNFGSVSFRLCKAENLVWQEVPTQRKVRCTDEWQILSRPTNCENLNHVFRIRDSCRAPTFGWDYAFSTDPIRMSRLKSRSLQTRRGLTQCGSAKLDSYAMRSRSSAPSLP